MYVDATQGWKLTEDDDSTKGGGMRQVKTGRMRTVVLGVAVSGVITCVSVAAHTGPDEEEAATNSPAELRKERR